MSTYPIVKLNDSTVIPGIGYGVGTAWFNAPETDEGGVNRPLVEAVKTALKVGYTHIDNAEAYNNEASVGVAIRESGVKREDLYITSKVGVAGFKDIRAAFMSQLKKLGVSYMDLYLIHWPINQPGTPGYTTAADHGMPTNEEAWAILEQLHDEGLAKSIGVSNYRIEDLEKTLKVARIRPSCNQIEMHPYVLKQSAPLLEYLAKEGIRVEAYGPTTPLTKFVGGPLDPILSKIATSVSSRSGTPVEASQILLLFASQSGYIVITTSGKDWRMKQQLEAGGLSTLTEGEMKEIREGGEGYHKRAFMQHMELV